MDLLVRLGLRHTEPEFARSLFEAVRDCLDPKARRVHAAALDALQERPLLKADTQLLEEESRDDWLWHLPLAESEGRKEVAFRHLEQFVHLARDASQDGGCAYACAEGRLLGERACEACGDSTAARTLVPSESFRRTLVVCPSCQELARSAVLDDWVRTGKVEKSNPLLERLARLRNPFRFRGDWSWPEPWNRGPKRPLKSKLRAHGVGVLERRLDRTCRQILERARELAAERGVREANPLAVLAAAAERMRATDEPSAELDSWIGAGRAAEARIEAAGPEDLAELLNTAGWSAMLDDATRTISRKNLLQALALVGRSSRLLLEIAPPLVWSWTRLFHLSMTPAHRDALDALAVRFPAYRYVALSRHVLRAGLCSPSDYLWFLRCERNCHLPIPVFTRGQEGPWADVVACWREVLSEDRSLLTLANADFFFLRHPEVAESLGLIGYETFRSSLFLTTFRFWTGRSLSRLRRLTVRVLGWLDELLAQDRHPPDQAHHLELAVSIADCAELPSEVKRFGARYLAGPRNDWCDRVILGTLSQWAARQGDHALAARYLKEIVPFVPSDNLMAEAAFRLWLAGHRAEFHDLLAHFRTLPDAQGEYLDRVEGTYRQLEEHWSPEDVMALTSLRLDDRPGVARRPNRGAAPSVPARQPGPSAAPWGWPPEGSGEQRALPRLRGRLGGEEPVLIR